MVDDADLVFANQLRKALLIRVQKDQDLFWNQMLSWFFVQQKEYGKAFIQEKAIYKREPDSFSNIVNLAELAIEDEEYETAKEIFSFILDNTQDLELQIQSHYYLMDMQINQATAKEYPQIVANSLIVDNTCMQLVMHPEKFDVMVMPNLYGDIVSDLTSGLIGGLGLLPSCNKGDDYAMYEAVHGSAPDIAGKHIANPSALLLSACMMLEDLHQESVATKIRNALNKTFEERKVLTFDLGGSASTDAFTDEIIKNL